MFPSRREVRRKRTPPLLPHISARGGTSPPRPPGRPPGGSRIPPTVLEVITNVIDRQMDIAAAVSAPRLHQQWLPDEVFVEPGLPPDVVHGLEARGDKVTEQAPWGSANSIMVTPDGLAGAADPRSRGALAVGQ